ncbi:MAG: hypothetical protein IKA23_02530 [Akkermansia sp.]|nr:hypothetical protein [Akkermansia sp.]
MNKLFQYALTGLLLLAPAGMAVQLSDLSPSLDRQAADDNLTKDYAYRVLSDLSVRRIWNLDDNRKLTVDFDGKTGKLICIVVDYRVPVSLEEADMDAADIGKFEEASWRKFSADKAAKYYMDRARAMKFEEGYMFEELSGANKCLRLTFYPKVPKENRRHLSEGSTSNGTSAMGNTLSGSAVKQLLKDEETRLYTPNKTDKPKEVIKPRKPVVDEEPEIEEPEEEPEVVVEEPKETGKVVKAPIEVKPIKTVKKKGDRGKDVDSLLAKLGLDKLEPIHWILIGIGFIILISVIGVVGRSNERRKLEQRAERLRNSPGALKASVRGKGKGDKSKLRI